MPIGFSRGNGKRPWQYGAGKGDHHTITLLKIARSTDDPANGRGIGGIFVGHPNLTPPNCLAIALFLGDKLEYFTDDDRAANLAAMNSLFFQANRHQGVVNIFGRNRIRQLNKLAQPSQRNTH